MFWLEASILPNTCFFIELTDAMFQCNFNGSIKLWVSDRCLGVFSLSKSSGLSSIRGSTKWLDLQVQASARRSKISSITIAIDIPRVMNEW